MIQLSVQLINLKTHVKKIIKQGRTDIAKHMKWLWEPVISYHGLAEKGDTSNIEHLFR